MGGPLPQWEVNIGSLLSYEANDGGNALKEKMQIMH